MTAIGLAGTTGLASPLTTLGDLFVGGASGVPARLGIGTGTPNQVLAVVGGVPTWFTLPMLVVPPSNDTSGNDDVTNINAAITELAAGPGSGDIWLLGGEYYINSTINLPWNMNLRGQGWATVINYLGGGATVTTPAVPGTSANVTNTTGATVQVYLTGGTWAAHTYVAVGGTSVTNSGQTAFLLPAGQTIQLNYATAPSAWSWVPLANSAIYVQDGTNPGNAPFTGQHLTRATIENLVIDGTGAGANAVLLDIWDVYGGYRVEGVLLRGATGANAVGLRIANYAYSANRVVGDFAVTECTTAVLFTTFGDENAIEHINCNMHIQLDTGQTAVHLAQSCGLQSCRWEIKVKSIAGSGPCIQMDAGTAFQACDFLLKCELAAPATTAQTIYYAPGTGAFFTQCRGILYFGSNYLPSNIGAQKFQFDGDIIGDGNLTNAQVAPPFQGYGNTIVASSGGTSPGAGPAGSGLALVNPVGVGCLVYYTGGTFTAPTLTTQAVQPVVLNVTGVTNAGTTVTVTHTTGTSLIAGQPVTIAGVTGFTGSTNPNGTWTVASVVSSTKFTCVVTTAPAGTYASGGTVTVSTTQPQAVGGTGASPVYVPNGGSITPYYSAAPTWTWVPVGG